MSYAIESLAGEFGRQWNKMEKSNSGQTQARCLTTYVIMPKIYKVGNNNAYIKFNLKLDSMYYNINACTYFYYLFNELNLYKLSLILN